MTTLNRKIILAARPIGMPKVSDFDLIFVPLPEPAAGEVLVRSVYLALDPWLRVAINGVGSGNRSIAIGGVITGAAVATVVESRDPAFGAGDTVLGTLGWQEYAVVKAHQLKRLDPGQAPITTALGVLGTPGLAAYFGLLDICDPQPGETVVVSGAAGGVGMLVGQIAKIRECRVVGVAGSDAKTRWLVDELDFDAAFNFKTSVDCGSQLQDLCPAGIDVFFDNMGGAISDAVMRLINMGARISVCGQMSQYNLEQPELGPRWLGQLIVKQAKVQGFQVSGYAERFPEALAHLAEWLKQGKLKYREDIAQGIETTPQAFIGMLRGQNQGKQLVQLIQ